MAESLLHHVRAGRGEPLILIHPLGAELVVWEPVMERLAAERDVIAVDLPGFGSSPPLAGGAEPTPQALAAAVGRLLDSLGLDRVHVAGNSLGGWVALELGRLGRALTVTGLCPAGFWGRPLGTRGGPDIRRLGRALLPLVPALVRSVRGRRALLSSSIGHPERVPPRAAARLVRSYVTAPGFEGANAAMRSAVFSGMREIEAPVTLAWGELDRLVAPPRQRPEGARAVLLRGCGHIPTWDDPAQVASVVLGA
ncbi:MAG TPA: alpha/beta fold hydrolase [Thermoleophilaceae bacterium]|nr:alpha/beta fold hydrolase [Thermoleophilaceae bacterium]